MPGDETEKNGACGTAGFPRHVAQILGPEARVAGAGFW